MKTASEHPPVSSSEKGAEPKLSQEPPLGCPWNAPSSLWRRKSAIIAAFSVAASGHLSPVSGAISQEVIDILAVLNA